MSKKTFAQLTQEPDNGAHSFTEAPNPWSFCETPEEKCTMNYCDENGCMNKTMKDLTKHYLDLSKCSEEERKQIAKLILIESGLSMSDYLDLLHGKIDEPNGSYLLEYAREQWHLSYDVLKHKTELLYPDFIKLFEDGEKEAPDPTAQLKADKAELLSALEKCWEVVPLDTYEGRRCFDEIDSLIKKHK